MSERRPKVETDAESIGYHCGSLRNPKISRAAMRRRSRLSNAEKRLMVIGRLSEPDAEGLTDRAIARELGVSQPFVSALRRHGSDNYSKVPREEPLGTEEPDFPYEPNRVPSEMVSRDRERAYLDTTPRARWVTRPARAGAATAVSDFEPFD